MAVPLGPKGQCIGLVYADNRGRSGSFTELDLLVLTALSHYIYLGIRNAQEFERTNLQLRSTAAHCQELRRELLLHHRIVGDSQPLLEVSEKARQLAQTDLPVLISGETGYHTPGSHGGHPGVSERAAAKYIPRLFLSFLKKGFIRAYLYEFCDEGTKEGFGLLDQGYNPKKQFYSIKNYIKILHDRGPAFETDSLDYSLEGDMHDIWHMLFQKRDGRFYLCVWHAAESFNTASLTDIDPPLRALTLKLPGEIKSAKIYAPLDSEKPQQTIDDVDGEISLQVPDHVLIVELEGAAAPYTKASPALKKSNVSAGLPQPLSVHLHYRHYSSLSLRIGAVRGGPKIFFSINVRKLNLL